MIDLKAQIEEAILSTLRVYDHDHKSGVPVLVLLGHAQEATGAKIDELQEGLRRLAGTKIRAMEGGEKYRIRTEFLRPPPSPKKAAAQPAGEPTQPRYLPGWHDYVDQGCEADFGVDLHFEYDHRSQRDPYL